MQLFHLRSAPVKRWSLALRRVSCNLPIEFTPVSPLGVVDVVLHQTSGLRQEEVTVNCIAPAVTQTETQLRA